MMLALAGLILAPHSPVLSDEIEITAVNTTIKEGTLYLDAVAKINLPQNVQDALNNGVGLFFSADMKIGRHRKLIPDKAQVNLEIIRRISFHPLTKRYIVDDLSLGGASSFTDLPDALSELGKYREIPLVNEAIISKSPDTHMLMRIRLIHKKLPPPLRLKRFFSKTWRLSSGWYAWSLE